MGRLILMTQREFEEPLTDVLRRAAPRLAVSFAWSLADLEAELAHDPEGSRILSVGSDVIVPRRVLAGLLSPAYNLHPGPPNYPGLFPSVFALYDIATELAESGVAPRYREALVSPSGTHELQSAQFYEDAMVNRGLTARMFADRASALAWLSSQTL